MQEKARLVNCHFSAKGTNTIVIMLPFSGVGTRHIKAGSDLRWGAVEWLVNKGICVVEFSLSSVQTEEGHAKQHLVN